MKFIKGSSKKGQSLIASADRYEGTTLADIYKSYSAEKLKEYNRCRRICIEEGGKDFHITGHNTYTFDVAWVRPNGDIRIETKCSSYAVFISF